MLLMRGSRVLIGEPQTPSPKMNPKPRPQRFILEKIKFALDYAN